MGGTPIVACKSKNTVTTSALREKIHSFESTNHLRFRTPTSIKSWLTPWQKVCQGRPRRLLQEAA